MAAQEFPLDRSRIDALLKERKVDPATAAIRELTLLVHDIEEKLGFSFLRMEFGSPGLDPDPIGIQAEHRAAENPRVVSRYGLLPGLPDLKKEASRFLKLFQNLEIPPEAIFPTVGSMQGSFISQAIAAHMHSDRSGILMVTPCFSVHRTQTKFLGAKEYMVDLYNRKNWLNEVEALCEEGKVSAILYSTPNNPSWVVLAEEELKRLGQICTKYDVIAIEDCAYFGMDFRHDYSVPGKPPYPPSVASFTDNYVYLFSASKVFSYAGQRIGLAMISPALAKREFPNLEARFGYKRFIDAFLMSGFYCTTSGVAHTAQHGLAEMLKRANDGSFRFLDPLKEYARRAKELKDILLKNGFYLVYDEDLGEPLSDGFFFTFAYPKMSGAELVREFLYYGISATTLDIAGSHRSEAVRGCVSLIGEDLFGDFRTRIEAFRRDHPA